MENQIQKQPFDPFVSWMSALTIRGNQLKLGRSNITCVLGNTQRELGLIENRLEQVSYYVLRFQLFKFRAVIHVTIRKVWVSLYKGR